MLTGRYTDCHHSAGMYDRSSLSIDKRMPSCIQRKRNVENCFFIKWGVTCMTIVTAKGKDSDCVSRSFFPKLLVAEDPVCGSAHCQIADYWSKELGKPRIHAYQASKRGGHLHCEMLDNGRGAISGEATLVAVSPETVFRKKYSSWKPWYIIKHHHKFL